jgi:hypothetical protein
MVLLGIDAGAGPAAGSPSGLKPAFSLDPGKRILLYSGVVQHYKFCSYYVTVFPALEVFRNAASELGPRLAVNPDRTWFSVRISGSLQGAYREKYRLLKILQSHKQKGSGSASKD